MDLSFIPPPLRKIPLLWGDQAKALTADLEQLGKEARKRIIENFSVENRKALLLNELKNKEC